MSNLASQASPLRLMMDITRKRHTGNFNPLPLVTMALCSAQWSFYAIFAWRMTDNKGFLTIVYANIVGVFLSSGYIVTFQAHCRDVDMWQMLKFYYQCAACIIIVEVVAIFVQ